MNIRDIEKILSWIYANCDGYYEESEVLRAIQYAYDIGFTTGREE